MGIGYYGPGYATASRLRSLAWDDEQVRPNPGLLFERFLALPPDRSDDSTNRNAIERFAARAARASKGGFALLAEWHNRMDDFGSPLETREPGGFRGSEKHLYADAELRTPLIIGGGNAHPLENGLLFHHTLGVPFIPGTALKGVVREWAEVSDQQTRLAELLGLDSEGTDPARRGDLVFFDALPYRQWPVIQADIINVHLRSYYGSAAGEGANREAVPFESPTPVFLPVVARNDEKGQPLRFRFRVGSVSLDAGNAEEGLRLLFEALDWLGVGAKTAVGYGVFQVVEATTWTGAGAPRS